MTELSAELEDQRRRVRKWFGVPANVELHPAHDPARFYVHGPLVRAPDGQLIPRNIRQCAVVVPASEPWTLAPGVIENLPPAE